MSEMTEPTPDIEALAAQRLAADEDRITGQARRRESLSLPDAWSQFWRHPSPWMISAFLVGSVLTRVAVGAGSWWELAIPGSLLVALESPSGIVVLIVPPSSVIPLVIALPVSSTPCELVLPPVSPSLLS